MSPPVLANLEQKLAYLGQQAPSVVRSAVLKSVRKMIGPMRSAARSAVAKDSKGKAVRSTGRMANSIGARGIKQNGTQIGAKAGPDVGNRRTDKQQAKAARLGHHAHLFISGTDHRYTGFKPVRKRGKVADLVRNKNAIRYRGRAPAHLPSFVTEGAKAAEGNVASTLKNELADGIERAIQRIG